MKGVYDCCGWRGFVANPGCVESDGFEGRRVAIVCGRDGRRAGTTGSGQSDNPKDFTEENTDMQNCIAGE